MTLPSYMCGEVAAYPECCVSIGDARSGRGVLSLYEMLSGEVPFPAKNGEPFSVMIGHMSRSPPPLRQSNLGVSQALSDVVASALAKDPAQRPTARELLRGILDAADAALGKEEVEQLLAPVRRSN